MQNKDQAVVSPSMAIVIGAGAGTVVGVSIGVANSNPVLMIGGPLLGLIAGIVGAWLIGGSSNEE